MKKSAGGLIGELRSGGLGSLDTGQDLMLAGRKAFEALTVSEVLYLSAGMSGWT